ncbi:hypothetical protein CJO66_12390 [Burkholderia ubonensis]|nr:hypothetical protein CJO70_23335 [Burkholderia ubonensis]PAJ92300.1 hypothetical protein CJO69_22850 [Burkholderia ubonensis]PAK05656.1 hypothetical protein CJO67_23015 [Burkholderia ubonensis]PAK14485.1 hypothetical protein CJO66_12390 [Burkholderia ubonensis]RQP67661.1 MarR family transcriptional regulator [Burkholderia ubonensis]
MASRKKTLETDTTSRARANTSAVNGPARRTPKTPLDPLQQPDLLDCSLGYAIKRAQVRCVDAMFQLLPPELSPARLTALLTIDANPGISQVALGTALNIAGPNVVKVVDALEALSLVTRQPSETDRRVYELELTPEGRSEVKRGRAIMAEFEHVIASRLTRAEREQLLTLLPKVAGAVQ